MRSAIEPLVRRPDTVYVSPMKGNDTMPIHNLIYEIRGKKVILDRDLADLYEVELRSLNQAVKRNVERFPSDFMFQLSDEEWSNLRSQIVIANNASKVRFLPYVFTEQGVAMLSSVLNNPKAISVNIQIMRVFVQMRHYALSQDSANGQIAELKRLLLLHIENSDIKFSEHDRAIRQIIHALNNLIEKPKEAKTIGFRPAELYRSINFHDNTANKFA